MSAAAAVVLPLGILQVMVGMSLRALWSAPRCFMGVGIPVEPERKTPSILSDHLYWIKKRNSLALAPRTLLPDA